MSEGVTATCHYGHPLIFILYWAYCDWVGIKTVPSVFTPLDQLPIESSADVLGSVMPKRNCRVMPSHTILIDDVLVVAGKLINGSTIRQLTQAELGLNYTYYTVETEFHNGCV